MEKKVKITFEDIRNNEAVRTYIQKADESLIALGFTEHSFAHVTRVAELAGRILLTVEYFEIFLNRMLLCRKAAEKLGLEFHLLINGQRLV